MYCAGNARQAEATFGWGRETVALGLHEARTGIVCLGNFVLDGKSYQTIDTLKAAMVSLPAGATVNLRGSCSQDDGVDLPPRAISLSDLREYCATHQVTFTWTFGAGGY